MILTSENLITNQHCLEVIYIKNFEWFTTTYLVIEPTDFHLTAIFEALQSLFGRSQTLLKRTIISKIYKYIAISHRISLAMTLLTLLRIIISLSRPILIKKTLPWAPSCFLLYSCTFLCRNYNSCCFLVCFVYIESKFYKCGGTPELAGAKSFSIALS